ncbi:MAG: hypothetical protein ABSC77_11805 [Terracidiphilus sp.]|jgi:hypothetical protein
MELIAFSVYRSGAEVATKDDGEGIGGGAEALQRKIYLECMNFPS